MRNIHLKLVLVPVFPLKRSQMKWVSCELHHRYPGWYFRDEESFSLSGVLGFFLHMPDMSEGRKGSKLGPGCDRSLGWFQFHPPNI